MIPAKEFSLAEFAVRYPPKCQLPTSDFDGISNRMSHEALLNDVPPMATSGLVYDHDDLKKHRPDPPVYPIPDDIKQCRELKSRQAVFKTIAGSDTCIFSHIYISPEDVEIVLGHEFIQRMKELQTDVHRAVELITDS